MTARYQFSGLAPPDIPGKLSIIGWEAWKYMYNKTNLAAEYASMTFDLWLLYETAHIGLIIGLKHHYHGVIIIQSATSSEAQQLTSNFATA